MNNCEIQVAWKYHDGTKHSYWSVRNHPHFLDWANHPLPFKIYPKIEPLPLPRDVPQTRLAALSAISQPVPSWRLTRSLAFRIWRASFISRQGLPNSAHIRVEKSTFVPQLAPERSTRSNCMSWLAISRTWMPACITSTQRMYRCGFCERVIFAETWLRRGDGTRGGSRARDDHLYRNLL